MINGKKIPLEWYEFQEIIAAGANGVTVKSYHKLTERAVAVKIWKPRTQNLVKYQNQFLSEIRKISKLEHPNIVTIYDGKILENGLCLAIYKFVDGITLNKWLTCSPTKAEKIRACKTILEAIEYYQKKDITHGDLHLDNILISIDGNISIIDFGTSIFSNQNKSFERECYFISTLVMKLLQEFDEYNVKHFCFNILGLKLELKKDPLMNFKIEPILLTETMRKYVDILDLLTHTNSFSYRDLVSISDFISKTRYLDINEFNLDMQTKYIEKSDHKRFLRIMISNIKEDMFPEYIEDNNRAERAYQASAAVYYEISKINDPNFEDLMRLTIENIVNKCYGGLLANEFDLLALEVNNLIIEAKSKTYFEIIPEIQDILKCNYREVQEEIRSALYNSLQKKYYNEPLRFPYWINTITSETLCNKENLKKIEEAIYLSEACC